MLRGVIRALRLRGPKKGKAEEQSIIVSDVINIFKDRTDPEVKGLSEYPPWVSDIAQGSEHPIKIAQRIYNGELLELSVREQRRLSRWSRKIQINVKNISKLPDMHFYPKKHERRLTAYNPTAEESDQDPEDHLGPYYNIATGVPYQDEIDVQMERLKINMEKK